MKGFMKTPNSLEEQMRSWTLRRPSPRIAEQLCAGEERALRAGRRHRAINLPWYQTLGVSVVGCTVALLSILNLTQLDATQRISVQFGPLSNHLSSLAMAAPHNTWTAPILGWTNDEAVGSPIRPFDLLNTN